MMAAKRELEAFLAPFDDCAAAEIWKLIEAYVEEEHQARCDDCDPTTAGFCDSCERIDPDNPPERDNEGYL